MTDVQKLLDEATPLPWDVYRMPDQYNEGHPWRVVRDMGEGGPGEIARIYWRVRDEGKPDAALIVHAVNHLPDYEAAVDALERLLRESERRPNSYQHAEADAKARAVLRRLRGEG